MLGIARLRRLFNRARVDVEINILRGILNSVEKLDTPPIKGLFKRITG